MTAPITCRAWAGELLDLNLDAYAKNRLARIHGEYRASGYVPDPSRRGAWIKPPEVSPSAEYRAAGLVPLDDVPGAWVSARLYEVVEPWFWLGGDA